MGMFGTAYLAVAVERSRESHESLCGPLDSCYHCSATTKKINYRHNFTYHSSLTVVRLPHRVVRDHDSKQDLCLKRGKFFLAPRLGFNRCTTSPFGLPKLGWKWLKTLFWLKCYERKTLFRLKKEAEQAEYRVSQTGPINARIQRWLCVERAKKGWESKNI